MRTLLLTLGTATLLTAGTLAAGAATTAPAENPGPVEQNSKAMGAADQADMAHLSIRKQIEDQLTKSGYTAVQVIPSSFLVRAKDKKGEPVEMVIGPDSLTTITEVAPAAGQPATPATPAPKG